MPGGAPGPAAVIGVALRASVVMVAVGRTGTVQVTGLVVIADRVGSAPSRVMPAAASARAMILSTTRMSACPVTTGSATASQAAASASLPVR